MEAIKRYHIYALLAAVVVADQEVLAVEVDTFVNLATQLHISLEHGQVDSHEVLKAWFDDHHAGIRKALLSDIEKGRFLVSNLEPLIGFEYCWQVLAAMQAIAVSDNELHKTERELIQTAANYWGLKYPE